MIKTINLTHQEESALKDVFYKVLKFASKSPNTAALLDISPINQERVEQILGRIQKAKSHDGRNVYTLPRNLRPAHESSATNHQPPTVAEASAAHGDH